MPLDDLMVIWFGLIDEGMQATVQGERLSMDSASVPGYAGLGSSAKSRSHQAMAPNWGPLETSRKERLEYFSEIATIGHLAYAQTSPNVEFLLAPFRH
jgi:hypothetical protein